MTIVVRCQDCGRQFRADEKHEGRRAKCPACGTILTIAGKHVLPYDVFVSYSHEDKAIADAVCATLERARLRCWIAPRDVVAGLDWGAAIIGAIKQCRSMVLVYSSHANSSEQVKREIERAVHRGIPVVPFRIEDVPPSEALEYFISSHHWLDALTPPLEKHLDRLATSLTTLLAQQQGGTATDHSGVGQPVPMAPPTRSWSPTAAASWCKRHPVGTGSAAVVLLFFVATLIVGAALRPKSPAVEAKDNPNGVARAAPQAKATRDNTQPAFEAAGKEIVVADSGNPPRALGAAIEQGVAAAKVDEARQDQSGRTFVYKVWALADVSELENLLPKAREAFAELKRLKDYFTTRTLFTVTGEHLKKVTDTVVPTVYRRNFSITQRAAYVKYLNLTKSLAEFQLDVGDYLEAIPDDSVAQDVDSREQLLADITDAEGVVRRVDLICSSMGLEILPDGMIACVEPQFPSLVAEVFAARDDTLLDEPLAGPGDDAQGPDRLAARDDMDDVFESRSAGADPEPFRRKFRDLRLHVYVAVGRGGWGASDNVARAARWIIEFSPDDAPERVPEMRDLGMNVAAFECLAAMKDLGMSIAFPKSGDEYLFFQGVSGWYETSGKRKLGQHDDMVYCVVGEVWEWEVKEIARLLQMTAGESQIAPTQFMLLFIPRQTVERMAQLEQAYRGLAEDDILATKFRVVRYRSKYDLVVSRQATGAPPPRMPIR